MINYTTDYNTFEFVNDTFLKSVYCIIRGENESGLYETLGETISFNPPIEIENFNSLTKEDVDNIVKLSPQYAILEQKIADGINARASIVVKDPPWVVPEVIPPPVINPVPQAVTPLQIRMAINAMDLREQVEAYVATLDQTAQDAWEYATIIERNNPILVNGAIAMGKTVEELDQLFILADSFV